MTLDYQVELEHFAHRHRHAVALARQTGMAIARNLGPVLAGSAVMLYAAGLARRFGQFAAEGIDPMRALPLAPLQTYFVEGLAILFDPTTAVYFVTIIIAVAVTRSSFGPARPGPGLTPDERTRAQAVIQRAIDAFRAPGDQTSTSGDVAVRIVTLIDRGLIVGRIILAAIVLGAALLLFEWPLIAPGLLAAVPAGLFAFGMLRGNIPRSMEDWTPFYTRLVTLVMVSGILLTVFSAAFIAPAPLDEVDISTSKGTRVSGKLLAQGNGWMYTLAPSQHAGHARIVGVPAGSISRIELREGDRPNWKSLAEMLGIPLKLELPTGVLPLRLR